MDVEEYTETAIRSAAIALQWQASDVSEDGGDGYPITERGDEYTDAVAEVPDLVEAVTSFVADNWATLRKWNKGGKLGPAQVGHDLVLTANGHGTGFWDRGLGELGRKLTDACEGYSFDAEFQLWGDRADDMVTRCSDEVGYLMVENTVIVDDMGICDE